jgi:hypothetical protein
LTSFAISRLLDLILHSTTRFVQRHVFGTSGGINTFRTQRKIIPAYSIIFTNQACQAMGPCQVRLFSRHSVTACGARSSVEIRSPVIPASPRKAKARKDMTAVTAKRGRSRSARRPTRIRRKHQRTVPRSPSPRASRSRMFPPATRSRSRLPSRGPRRSEHMTSSSV